MLLVPIRIMQIPHAKMLLITCFLDCLLSFSFVNQFWFNLCMWKAIIIRDCPFSMLSVTMRNTKAIWNY